MRAVHGRFERWRKSHHGRLPIPDVLWRAAAGLAKQHGVFRTAKALRLDYTKLKTMAVGSGKKRKPATPPRFVELLPPPASSQECVIEWEGPRGKMCIHWKDVTAADVARLTRMLWESE